MVKNSISSFDKIDVNKDLKIIFLNTNFKLKKLILIQIVYNF